MESWNKSVFILWVTRKKPTTRKTQNFNVNAGVVFAGAALELPTQMLWWFRYGENRRNECVHTRIMPRLHAYFARVFFINLNKMHETLKEIRIIHKLNEYQRIGVA